MRMYQLIIDDAGNLEIQDAEGKTIHTFDSETEAAIEIVEAVDYYVSD